MPFIVLRIDVANTPVGNSANPECLSSRRVRYKGFWWKMFFTPSQLDPKGKFTSAMIFLRCEAPSAFENSFWCVETDIEFLQQYTNVCGYLATERHKPIRHLFHEEARSLSRDTWKSSNMVLTATVRVKSVHGGK